jgi:protein-tyrosine phosphatase
MHKILFVCLGNICRSPMAEFYMKDLVRREGCADRFEIASAATSNEERGNPVYPPARRKLMEHGIDPSGKTARQMTRADYEHYDLLICMDASNLRNMERICGGDPDGKMSMLMSFAGRNEEVADPWYTGDFAGVYQQITEGCRAMLAQLKNI